MEIESSPVQTEVNDNPKITLFVQVPYIHILTQYIATYDDYIFQ